MDTPINPVVRGLMNGMYLAQQIRQAAMQREELAMRKEQLRMQKEQQEQKTRELDIKMTDAMLESGRPVLGDAVIGDAVEDVLPGIPGVSASDARITRKADPKRTVKWKRSDGQEVSVELFTPEERRKIERTRKADDTASASDAALAAKQKELDSLRVQVPGMGAMHPSLVDDIRAMEIARTNAETRRQQEQDRFKQQWALQRDRQAHANRLNEDKQEFTKKENEKKRANAITAARTGAQAAVQERWNAEQKKEKERRISALDKELADLDRKAVEYGNITKKKEGEEFTFMEGAQLKRGAMSRAVRETFLQKADQFKKQADQRREERKRLAGEIGWGTEETPKVGDLETIDRRRVPAGARMGKDAKGVTVVLVDGKWRRIT